MPRTILVVMNDSAALGLLTPVAAVQVKEILAYAAQRFIEVVPEIELPGHCGAALASYPYLGCTGTTSIVPIRERST